MLSPFSRLAQAVSKNPVFREVSLRARNAKQAAAVKRLRDINAFERRVFSQNGEDGVIAELFARIPHNRYFVEIGVEDGQQCNGAVLARHYGWEGLMIEADSQMCQRLQENYESLPVSWLELQVTRENIAPVLEKLGIPKALDLLCIDIDGNDYYVWEALEGYAASVVVIEYNASFGRDACKTIAYNPEHVWRKDRYYGASLAALVKLGARLGYALVGTERRGINAFFVRRDLLAVCGFPERSASEVWRPNVLGRLLPEGSGAFFEP
jgi:hypothetical protein